MSVLIPFLSLPVMSLVLTAQNEIRGTESSRKKPNETKTNNKQIYCENSVCTQVNDDVRRIVSLNGTRRPMNGRQKKKTENDLQQFLRFDNSNGMRRFEMKINVYK